MYYCIRQHSLLQAAETNAGYYLSVGQADRLRTQRRTDIAACRIPSASRGISIFFLLRPSTDWMRPTHVMEHNLLYSKPTDLNVNYMQTIFSGAASRLVFVQTTRHCYLVKLTRKVSNLEACFFLYLIISFLVEHWLPRDKRRGSGIYSSRLPGEKTEPVPGPSTSLLPPPC